MFRTAGIRRLAVPSRLHRMQRTTTTTTFLFSSSSSSSSPMSRPCTAAATTATTATLSKIVPRSYSNLWLGHVSLPARTLTFRTQRVFSSSSKKPSPSTSSSSWSLSSWWHNFLAPKPMPPRYTAAWYREMVLICTVFAITGSTTMVVVRPMVSQGLGLKGSIIDGPWSYRLASLIIMSPIYGILLVCVGTLAGRHAYFRHFSVKLFGRFGIPSHLLDKNFEQTSKHFKKW